MNIFRRSFLKRITMAGAGGMAGLEAANAASYRTIVYQVKGFSCPTCAIGLDTLLGKMAGVVKSKSTYPEGKVTIQFDPANVTEPALKALILEQGFTASGPLSIAHKQ